ncbi:hypothetical protein GCM10009808_19960 [Microbacterium sediminicola]|uniref:DUF998 domain-containing protein n=2 Tax=Microbacterium sediminicola TaxID=415210 RepID=A0ABN2IBS5_9MICO
MTASVRSAGQRTLESLALALGAIAFVVVGLIAIPVFGLDDAPIAGEGSVGQFAAISSGATALVAFGAGRGVAFLRSGEKRFGLFDYVDAAALALAHGIIAVLSWTLLAVILDRAFIDAQVFALPVLVLSGTAAAVTAYLVFASATHLDASLLALILAAFLGEGILAAMLTANDPHWWRDNLSALGMTEDMSGMTFNITLILGGFLVTTLARYATRGIPTTHVRGILAVRICLIVIGVFLACVGIFPVNQFWALHTGSAAGMAVTFGVLVVMLRHWVPGIPATFALLGWIFFGVLVVLGIEYAIGYYTLTAVELVGAVLLFAWIVMFIRNIAALQSDAAPGLREGAPPALASVP